MCPYKRGSSFTELDFAQFWKSKTKPRVGASGNNDEMFVSREAYTAQDSLFDVVCLKALVNSCDNLKLLRK